MLELKAFPVGMELFPSADDEQWEFIKHEIESSDYYVVLVAGKYGSLAADGQSFTEKEYDHAVSLRKPVMGFLAKHLDQLKGFQLEEDADLKQKLHRFREKVSRERLVKFYESPDELKAQVMQAIVHSFQCRPQEGWVRAKNARRIEDLERINELQSEVIELRATLARLEAASVDPTAQFAQGEELVEFKIILSPGNWVIPGPSRWFTCKTTWNALLLTCFFGRPSARTEHVQARIAGHIVQKLGEDSPEFGEWLARHPEARTRSGSYPPELEAFVKDIFGKTRLQFMGLGLIDFQYDEWVLTQKGRLQLLEISGVRRDTASSGASLELPEDHGNAE